MPTMRGEDRPYFERTVPPLGNMLIIPGGGFDSTHAPRGRASTREESSLKVGAPPSPTPARRRRRQAPETLCSGCAGSGDRSTGRTQQVWCQLSAPGRMTRRVLAVAASHSTKHHAAEDLSSAAARSRTRGPERLDDRRAMPTWTRREAVRDQSLRVGSSFRSTFFRNSISQRSTPWNSSRP